MEKLENKNPGSNDGYTPLHSTVLERYEIKKIEFCNSIGLNKNLDH